MSNKKLVYVIPLCGFLTSVYAVSAGAASNDYNAAIRNIQQNGFDNPSELKAPVRDNVSDADKAQVGVLQSLDVRSEFLKEEIKSYWASHLAKPVTQQDIKLFKSWAWDRFRQAGYFSYVNVESKNTATGLKLAISVETPKLNKVMIGLENTQLSPLEESLLVNRLSRGFKIGEGIDTVSLDHHLQNASFGYPYEFDANIKQVGPGLADLAITSRAVASQTGQLLSSVVQLNSYGLKQYGRPQLMGVLNYGGLAPQSQLQIAAQVSEGVKYGRLEYTTPIRLLRGELNAYASYSDFSSVIVSNSAIRGDSVEIGAGLANLLAVTRYSAFKSHVDFSARKTASELKSVGTTVGDLSSSQARLGLSVDNSKIDADQYNLALSLVGGTYDNSIMSAGSVDGGYGKFELSGRYVKSLTKQQDYFLQTRFRGQLAATNLDSYDRISLGGINGVRAYTSSDGLGDQGALVSFDLIHTLPYHQYVGVFYDAGLVKPFKDAIAGQFNDVYTLQALGAQYGITYKKASLLFNLAKGIGGYDGYVTGNIESRPDNWRGNAALTISF